MLLLRMGASGDGLVPSGISQVNRVACGVSVAVGADARLCGVEPVRLGEHAHLWVVVAGVEMHEAGVGVEALAEPGVVFLGQGVGGVRIDEHDIQRVEVHPGGGTQHHGPYVEISSSSSGRVTIADSRTYVVRPGEKGLMLDRPISTSSAGKEEIGCALVWCLRALAQPYHVQTDLYPQAVQVADELANDWEYAFKNYCSTNKGPQKDILSIHHLLLSISGHEDYWTDEALRRSQEWQGIREAAKVSLQSREIRNFPSHPSQDTFLV